MFLFPLGLQIFMDGSAAAFVQPGLQQRKVSVHPADVILDGLVGLPDTPQLWACLLGQGAKEAFHLSTEVDLNIALFFLQTTIPV